MHVMAVTACVPCSSTFDYTAGALFGLLPGVGLTMIGKTTAALLTYSLVTSLSKSPIGCWIQQRARGGRQGSRWAAHAARLHQGVRQGGCMFCILAGVPFSVYAPASIMGMLPPTAANVYQGFA
eukprot:CAMPEP_0169143064 /NCGR_PEP_ID=MMETSP1015-20121227/45358_1 /TAXON_ID=342587 /ORGANISM="Karlodinium micrum, Strain CCMP2283" /LENGTH=123 /DNA_ID=CAMNT_0009209921 /DNA_START=188 /DNA_END=556 /DNA_ORIENTATION=-